MKRTVKCFHSSSARDLIHEWFIALPKQAQADLVLFLDEVRAWQIHEWERPGFAIVGLGKCKCKFPLKPLGELRLKADRGLQLRLIGYLARRNTISRS